MRSIIESAERPLNILIDDLPETITVNGRSFPIDTDFRTAILFELMLMDPKLTPQEKAANMYYLFFTDEAPEYCQEAADALQIFYACGEKPEPKRRRRGKAEPEPDQPRMEKRVYDFQVDSERIVAAFLSEYGIDLCDIEYMHWWKFMALFHGLSDDQQIMKIIGYRSINLSKIKDKDTRSHYAELQRKYALPNPMSDEDKVAAAGRAFSGGIG